MKPKESGTLFLQQKGRGDVYCVSKAARGRTALVTVSPNDEQK